MAGVEIERLALLVPGLPAEHGRRLVELVADRLAQVRWGSAQQFKRMDVTVTCWSTGESLEQLADSIATELRRRVSERG